MAVADNALLRFAAHFVSENASDIVNVFHAVMDSVGTVDEGDVLDDLLALVEALMTNVSGAYSPTTELDRIEAWVRNTTLNRWDSIGMINGTWVGTNGNTEELPAAVAPYIRLDTVDAQAKGSKYLPPPAENFLLNGLFAASMTTGMLVYLDDLASTFIGTNAEYAQGIWQEASQAFRQYTGTGTVTNVPAYQRRRKPGVGD